MSENKTIPTLVVVKADGDANVSAQDATQGAAPSPPAPNPSKPRRRRQVVSRRPPAKPKPQLPPEEEARRRAEVRRRRRERIAQIDVDNLPEAIGVAEVALLLRLSANTIYVLAAQEKIPSRRCGRTFRFSKTAVLRWLGAQGPDSLPSR